MANSMKDIEDNVSKAIDGDGSTKGTQGIYPNADRAAGDGSTGSGEGPNNGGSTSSHAADAANKTGIFDPKYDGLNGIQKQRMNVLHGRDNDDDGDDGSTAPYDR